MRSLTLFTTVLFSATMTLAQQSNLQLVNPFWDVSDQTAVQASLLSAGPTDSTYVLDCRPSAILTATDTVNNRAVITTTPCASNWVAETYTFIGNTSLHFTYSASYGPVATADAATATVLDVAAEMVSADYIFAGPGVSRITATATQTITYADDTKETSKIDDAAYRPEWLTIPIITAAVSNTSSVSVPTAGSSNTTESSAPGSVTGAPSPASTSRISSSSSTGVGALPTAVSGWMAAALGGVAALMV